MGCALVIIATLLNASGPGGAERAGEDSSAQLVQVLLDQGIPPGRILGSDRNGIPRVCGTTGEAVRPPRAALSSRGDELPPGTRAWECIPGVIRDDGVDAFRLEVDVNGDVLRVMLAGVSSFLIPPGEPPFDLRDDGLGDDRVAGDRIFTAGPFRYNTSLAMPAFYMNDPTSPAGLFSTVVGNVTIEELDGPETNFLIDPEIGLLRADLPDTAFETLSPDIVISPHLINVRSDARESQHFLRFLGGELRNLTNPIYEVVPDVFDFLVFFSSSKIELLPQTSFQNFIAGIHSQVQTNFTGTGLTAFDGTASYGSSGVLLSVNVLDAYARGIVGNNVTHELTHQWSSFTSTLLGLSDGSGHYKQRSSAGSLVGGFQWIDNGDGTFTLNCGEGRNGATHAPPINLYMMGLVEGDTVPTLHLNETINFATDCGELVESLVDITIDDIQAVHGVRDPGPESAQRNFRVAFVVESHNRLLNPTEMTYYEILAEHYTSPIPPGGPAPYIGPNWPSVDRFFKEGTTWTTAIQVSDTSIPTVSRWGMVTMTLLMLTAGTLASKRRRPIRA